ncbi:hypothetical protein AC249_AIPGENE10403 [Exaiptasia diaphana]|nr:hypothetical protein AC249_AIPGENE10403 [Exaiptasia diaphana]
MRSSYSYLYIVYEAVRLVFGDRASPFLAQYLMRRHAAELRGEYELALKLTKHNTRMELVELLSQAGFSIRRWCSWSRMVRVTSWVLRFIKQISRKRRGDEKEAPPTHLTAQEIKETGRFLILRAQSK